jgi:ribose 5-phosphate isomerase B
LKIAIGSDHAGYDLKTAVAAWLLEHDHQVVDLGTDSGSARVDYPDFARAVAEAVVRGDCERGIAICGTGLGVCMTANKVVGIRAALCTDSYMARMSRQHNDANVLCLGQRVLGVGLALDIVKVWLETGFEGGRHAQRLAKLD